MKKIYFLFLLALLPLVASANAVEIGGIYYNLDSQTRTAEVTSKTRYYSGSVVIPESVIYKSDEYRVTSIGKNAFSWSTQLTSVTIPNSVISIGEMAFFFCWSLTSVTIPNSVTSIGDNAFNNCWNLPSITIPNSVTSIGNNAFSGCSWLTSVAIPNSVTSISHNAFTHCGLTSITVESGNTVYDSRNNCNAIIEKSSNTLIAGCINTTIPNSVTSIGDWAFSGCNLASINIPNSVTRIGDSAFEDCSALTSLTIPNSVTRIGEFAFKNCKSMTSMTIPSSVISIGQGIFYGCSDLTSITVDPNNPYYNSHGDCNAIIYDDRSTMENCHLLVGCKNTTIPYDVEIIDSYAFAGCDGLTSITFPDRVKSIDEYAFTNCNGLSTVNIPNSVIQILEGAFYGCSNLYCVGIGTKVANIGNRAFGGCVNLSHFYCFSTTPPYYTHLDAFNGDYYGYKTLHVPEGCFEAYADKKPWNYFDEIEETTTIKVNLNKTKAYLQKGKTLTLKATFTPSYPDMSVTWKSSNTSVATVTSDGKVKGVKAGTATITCTSNATGAKGTCKLTVGYVKLDQTDITIKKGKTVTLTPTVYPSSLTDKSVTWKSSNTKVATVTSDGKVKGVKTGSATITCTSVVTGLSTTCKVLVGNVVLSETKVTLEKGKTVTLTATVYPSSLTDKSVTWKSSDTEVATVTSSGKVKGVKAGTATITCTSVATGVSATCKVTVTNGTLTLDKSEAYVQKGKTMTLTATVTPSTLEDKSVTWESSDTKIATVTSDGKVKGVKYGTATITCTSAATGTSATCKVTVGKVIIGTSEVTIRKSRTTILTATVYPSTLEDKSVIWESSDESIATVTAEGMVKGIKAGTATITCTSVATGLKGTCTVTVLSSSGGRSVEGDGDNTTGIEKLEEAPALAEPYDVYDLSGHKVRHQVTSLDGLPDGIYIVNGKKVLKK